MLSTTCSRWAIRTAKIAASNPKRATQTRRRPLQAPRIPTLAKRFLATHTEPSLDEEISEELYFDSIPPSGYTSRHVLSIFPPLPVLDKLQELQSKLTARTRIVPVPRTGLQIVLVPLGTSLEDPAKLQLVKKMMDKVARETQPVAIEIGGLGCLPKWNKPREVYAGLTTGKEQIKTLIKQLEVELNHADLNLNEPGAVKHRTRIPLGKWEDVYVTNLQGDLAKDVADSIGQYTQASFTAKEMVLLEQKPDSTLVPVHVSLFGANLLSKKRARYKALL